MTRDELLAALKDSRAQMDAALDGLAEAQMVERGVMGEWTVKDILAHLTACEVQLVTNLGRARRGQSPRVTVWTEAQVQAQNEKWYQEYKERPLDRVLADYFGVRKQTIAQLQALNDQQLAAPVKWLRNMPLYEYFQGETFEHEAEHARHIREWRERTKVGEV